MDKFVLVYGGTKKQRWLVEDIAWWFCEKYFKRFKSFNIEIDLCKIPEKVQGWCMEIDKNCSHIQIDKRLEGDDFITCVLHELVHVKQFARKELDDMMQYWKGRDCRDTEYWDQPWEKEARKLQQKLMKAYMAKYES